MPRYGEKEVQRTQPINLATRLAPSEVLVVTNCQGSSITEVQTTLLYPALVGRIGGLIHADFIWTIIASFIIGAINAGIVATGLIGFGSI
jgi:hypothetical protein